MIAKLLHANTRYLALVILAILVVGYTSMSGMARKEDPAITPGSPKSRFSSLARAPQESKHYHQTHGRRPREEPDVMEVDGTLHPVCR